MKIIAFLLGTCCLCFCLGCAGDKGSWDAVKRDLRGDNMEMRGFGSMKDMDSSSLPQGSLR